MKTVCPRGPRGGAARLVALGAAAFLAGVAFLACDNTTTGPGGTLVIDGTVTSLYGEGAVTDAEITADVVAGNGRVWTRTTSDGAGAFSLELDVPGGCRNDSARVLVEVVAADHGELVRGAPGDALRLSCAEPNTLDLTPYRNTFREPQMVAGDLVPTQLSVGREHACAITETGAYCWGASWYGRLGNASAAGDYLDYAESPVAVTNGQNFVQIAAGNEHTCALDDAGAAWCWGANFDGQVGADTSQWVLDEPYRVQTDLQFTQIAAGRFQSCGLATDGAVYCWGDDRGTGSGGDPGDDIYTTPQPVVLDGTYVQVSSLFSSTCALRDDGALYCWGFSYAGELGGGEDQGQHTTPVLVAGDHSWSAVSTGVVFGCGLTTDGAAWCWGRDDFGRLGNGVDGDSSVPTAVSGGRSYASIDAGEAHGCAIDGAGEAWCWGNNGRGALGLPPETVDGDPLLTTETPVRVPTELRFTTLQGGGYNYAGFTCGITTDQALVCWGAREYLGSGRPLMDAAADLHLAREEAP